MEGAKMVPSQRAVAATGIHTSGQPRNYRVSQLPIATCWFVGFVVGWFWEFGKLQQWWHEIRKARCYMAVTAWGSVAATPVADDLSETHLFSHHEAICMSSHGGPSDFSWYLVRTPSPPRPWLWASPVSCMVSLGGSDEVFSLVQ